MYFALNWDDGYIVTCTRIWEDGNYTSKPLRKFKEQGDAIVFKQHDCPHLSELQLKGLVKQYNPNDMYIRINERKFRKIAK